MSIHVLEFFKPLSSTFSHTFFKRTLVERFKKRNEDKEARERYMTETYTKMMATWSKKIEKIENSKRRKEREGKARELYEKIFPEIRKLREDKERDHRLGTRGTVRSEADIEDVIERLQEQEVSNVHVALFTLHYVFIKTVQNKAYW